MKPVKVHPQALQELAQAMRWYNRRQTGLGEELKQEVLKVLDRIEAHPERGAKYRDTDYQFVRTERFPYLLYYRELPGVVFISAIAHGRRRLGYWRRRMP